jgi:hypothetical protein
MRLFALISVGLAFALGAVLGIFAATAFIYKLAQSAFNEQMRTERDTLEAFVNASGNLSA